VPADFELMWRLRISWRFRISTEITNSISDDAAEPDERAASSARSAMLAVLKARSADLSMRRLWGGTALDLVERKPDARRASAF
jgi:hypothetical protein